MPDLSIIIEGIPEALQMFAPGSIRTGIARGVRAVALFLEGEVKIRWLVRTGRGRSSTGARQVGEMEWEVRPGVPYARFVEEGTKPHIIRARRVRALRWVQNGRVRFAKRVNHPGTQGAHMFARAVSENRSDIERVASAQIQRALRQFSS